MHLVLPLQPGHNQLHQGKRLSLSELSHQRKHILKLDLHNDIKDYYQPHKLRSWKYVYFLHQQNKVKNYTDGYWDLE